MKSLFDHLLLGFAATLLLTTIMSLSVGLGFSRMNIPFMLGSMFAPNRDRAKRLGFAAHVVNGWIFALFYMELMDLIGIENPWMGAAIGLVHGVFVLTALMALLPSFHPRMATEDRGPDPTRQLEPPGFLALNYGRRTPLVTLAAHVAYGAVIGLLAP